MQVVLVTENADGSADVVFNLTPDEVSALLSDAILRAIRLWIDECEGSVQK